MAAGHDWKEGVHMGRSGGGVVVREEWVDSGSFAPKMGVLHYRCWATSFQTFQLERKKHLGLNQ
jgi:hypothetical protein